MWSVVPPPVSPIFRLPPRLAWLGTEPVLVVLELLQAASRPPAPANAPVAAIPRRNWRRSSAAAESSPLLSSDLSTKLPSSNNSRRGTQEVGNKCTILPLAAESPPTWSSAFTITGVILSQGARTTPPEPKGFTARKPLLVGSCYRIRSGCVASAAGKRRRVRESRHRRHRVTGTQKAIRRTPAGPSRTSRAGSG